MELVEEPMEEFHTSMQHCDLRVHDGSQTEPELAGGLLQVEGKDERE